MKDAAWSEYCKTLASTIVESCTGTPMAGGQAALVRNLARALPDWKVRHALVRGGWYRTGGVVDRGGSRISEKLEAWADAELAARGGDLAALAEDLAEQELYATRLIGQTHYLVASAGDGSDDFLQLEIEELQEVRSHLLGRSEDTPNSLEDIVDPPGTGACLQPLGLPFASFRKLIHVGSFLKRMLAQKPEPAPIHRLISDWSQSSAGHASALFNHWVIATREHLDRYQQPIFHAQPIATFAASAPEFSASPSARGMPLQAALSAFDHEIGYPMAWYFHMLTTKAVPHWVAQAVVEDSLAGFAYLPQRDTDVVRAWLHRPYGA